MLYVRERSERELARHPLIAQRMLRAQPTVGNSLFARVSAYVAPYSMSAYPGRMRLLLSVIGHRRGWGAVKEWGRGVNRLPPWAADAFAAHIRAQCEVGLALADELERHAAELRDVPHHLSAAGRMAKARAARRPGSAMGARARQLPRTVPDQDTEPCHDVDEHQSVEDDDREQNHGEE